MSSNLIASMIVRNEFSRYLRIVIPHLAEICDEIRVLDDASDDGTYEWLTEQDRVAVKQVPVSRFYEHEGRARQALLDWTVEGKPTHVLAVDADEIVTDGDKIRAATNGNRGGSWTLQMEEVWKADEHQMWTREDTLWRQHPVPIMWRLPTRRHMSATLWKMPNRPLASGRTPMGASRQAGRIATGSSIIHLGWLNPDRAPRYERYVKHDGGRFHNRKHLDSIMWPDDRVIVKPREWPEGVDRQAVLEAAGLLEPVA